MLQVASVLTVLVALLAIVSTVMAVRSIQLQSGTSGLRSGFPEAVDIQADSVDHRMKYLGDDGNVHAIVVDDLQAAPVTTTAATLALTQLAHANRTLVVNSATGWTGTLPAATGSGAIYRIFVGTTLTGGSFVLQVANALDFMRGQAWTVAAANAGFLTANTGTVATESDTITFNRTTTGLGTIGDYIEVQDIAPHVWAVEADYASSGTAATPFSAAV
jgi:hypothetical protein